MSNYNLTDTHHTFSIPTQIIQSIKKFKKDYPDQKKMCFIMMRFADTMPHKAIYKTIQDTMKNHGIQAARSDDKEYHNELYGNILTYIHGCGFGVAVFERIETDIFNPNVAYEVGYMHALNKPVCLLKDKNLTSLHADLIGKLYRPFDTLDPENSIPSVLEKWMLDNLISVPEGLAFQKSELAASETSRELLLRALADEKDSIKIVHLSLMKRRQRDIEDEMSDTFSDKYTEVTRKIDRAENYLHSIDDLSEEIHRIAIIDYEHFKDLKNRIDTLRSSWRRDLNYANEPEE